MIRKKIISILITVININTGICLTVKYWPNTTSTQELSKDQDNRKNSVKTYTYQDLEDLKNDFNDAYHEGDLNNFKNPTTEFKKLQEEFVEKFKTNFIAFENQFQQIDQNNSTQINELYREYYPIVNFCDKNIEQLRKENAKKFSKYNFYYYYCYFKKKILIFIIFLISLSFDIFSLMNRISIYCNYKYFAPIFFYIFFNSFILISIIVSNWFFKKIEMGFIVLKLFLIYKPNN